MKIQKLYVGDLFVNSGKFKTFFTKMKAPFTSRLYLRTPATATPGFWALIVDIDENFVDAVIFRENESRLQNSRWLKIDIISAINDGALDLYRGTKKSKCRTIRKEEVLF